MKVFVTGAGGWTARAIFKVLLRAGHDVVGLDLPGSVPAEEDLSLSPVLWVTGSVADPAVVSDASRLVDATLHLAVAIGEGDYTSPEAPFSTNVLGAYNVFDAARRCGVRKVVLIGSASVHLPQPEGRKVDARSDWRSITDETHLYDLTKRLQEEIGRDFCETFGIDAVVLRAGHIVDGKEGVDMEGTPLQALDYCRGGWVCRYDLAEACLKALDFDGEGYQAFHVIGSRAARKHFDVERMENELGFCCQETFEEFD